jgi:N-acetylmuramoyl-L-alanine amidase
MSKSRDSSQKNVQRAAVRRAQDAGKRQAAASAARTAGSSRAAGGTARAARSPDKPARRRAKSPMPYDQPGAPVESVEVPYGLRRAFVLGVIALALVIVSIVVVRNWSGLLQLSAAQVLGTPAPAAVTTSDHSKRIGIVSGHHGNDSGSVCQDGLTEVKLNFDTAIRVAELLRAQGYTVDVLDEFDPRLKGYVALALVSIHADSCAYINDLATGFKVARMMDSKMPEEADRLVGCLTSYYKKATGLRFHASTVTIDMTQYHAFSEIDEHTPGAIIETGFMYLDRRVLTGKPAIVAQGVADGILCFVKGEIAVP